MAPTYAQVERYRPAKRDLEKLQKDRTTEDGFDIGHDRFSSFAYETESAFLERKRHVTLTMGGYRPAGLADTRAERLK